MSILKKCALSGEMFEVSEEDLAFYSMFDVPPPKLCPSERSRRRMSFRNFRNLYQRKCSATGEPIISMYHEAQAFPVYSGRYWWSDAWQAQDFALEYDPDKSFIHQYQALSQIVPRSALLGVNSENCDYCNARNRSKNCYLVFGCVRSEDCLYGHIVWDSKNCVDTTYAFRSEWCSYSVDIFSCYDVHFSQEVDNCRESYFLYDCRRCRNCFACIGLVNAEFCIYNKQLSREEYSRELDKLLPLSAEVVAHARNWLLQQRSSVYSYPSSFSLNADDSTGNHIYESADMRQCFDLKSSEKSAYCYTGFGIENCRDISFCGSTARFSLECLTSNAESLLSCHHVENSSNLAYSEFCYSSQDCLGCNGLRRAQYCILNKQYTRADYFRLRGEIVQSMKSRGEWGEFFPAIISPFAYNESIANEYMPLSESEAKGLGYSWRQEKTYEAHDRAARVTDTYSADAKTVYHCIKTNKPYRLLEQEITFAKRFSLPLPNTCPDERFRQRLADRAPRKLLKGKCEQCGRHIESAHFALSPKVRCEDCGR